MEKFAFRGEEVYSLHPLKFPWADKMIESARENNWHPKEIQMGRDKACYEQELSPVERHMFRHVFATLTTSDQAVSKNLIENVGRMVKAAELRAYIARQLEEEALHSLSYQHVLEVLALDREDVEGLWRKVNRIKQWFDWVEQCTTSDDLLLPLIFYYQFFEGVFFPTAFASIYSLQRRRLMVGTGEQVQYIHRDEVLHVGFGRKLILEGFKEFGGRPDQDIVHIMFQDSMNRLDRWAEYCIPDVLGYSAELHQLHSRYLANARLRQLGYEPVFIHAENVLPWLDEQAGIKKEKNFFETKVNDYRNASALEGTW
jgi:ribonucleoside-diphosphate reductase beta chain